MKKPIGVIRGSAELLANPKLEGGRRQEFSDLILADVDRLVGMTQEILDYSRGTMNFQSRKVQLGDWLDGVLKSLREDLTESGVELVTRFDYRRPVRIDPERLRRVLINIAGNASDAMENGGILTITTRGGKDFWELELADTGTGIPPELRPRIFEPFVTSGKAHGTGLGLAIVREIVVGHGGTIQLYSRVSDEESGQSAGSKFLIRMPADIPPNFQPGR